MADNKKYTTVQIQKAINGKSKSRGGLNISGIINVLYLYYKTNERFRTRNEYIKLLKSKVDEIGLSVIDEINNFVSVKPKIQQEEESKEDKKEIQSILIPDLQEIVANKLSVNELLKMWKENKIPEDLQIIKNPQFWKRKALEYTSLKELKDYMQERNNNYVEAFVYFYTDLEKDRITYFSEGILWDNSIFLENEMITDYNIFYRSLLKNADKDLIEYIYKIYAIGCLDFQDVLLEDEKRIDLFIEYSLKRRVFQISSKDDIKNMNEWKEYAIGSILSDAINFNNRKAVQFIMDWGYKYILFTEYDDYFSENSELSKELMKMYN